MSNTALETTKNLNTVGVIRSEWLKMRSLRSQQVLFIVLIVVILGLAALAALSLKVQFDFHMSQDSGGMSDSETAAIIADRYKNLVPNVGTASSALAGVLIASMATVFIASEYATGSIQSTLISVPRRSLAYFSKTLVITVFAFLVGFLGATIGFFVGQPIVGDRLTVGFNSEVLRMYAMMGVYLIILAWMGLGFGALLRSSAGGIVLTVVIMFVVQIILAIFQSQDWAKNMMAYMPGTLGEDVIAYKVDQFKDPSYGFRCFYFVLWGVVPLTLGWLRFKFSDTK